MSSKFPMVAIDKVEVKLTMPVECVVSVDKIGDMAGLSRAAVINGYVEDGLKKSGYKLTAEDDKRIEEIKAINRQKREAMKLKKGGDR